jgi:exosome complex component RRP4
MIRQVGELFRRPKEKIDEADNGASKAEWGRKVETAGAEKTREKVDTGGRGKSIVLPGELIDKKAGRKIGKNAYFEGDNVFSKVVGIPRVWEDEISVIPLSGVYLPQVNDRVIGIVTQVEISGWVVDINSPYDAFLPVSDGTEEFIDMSRTDLSRFFDVGDVIFCKVSKVTKNKTVRVSMMSYGARKLYGGITIKVTPSKIPRIIGRGGSMVNLIKEKTNSVIYTGQNGVVWIRGDDKDKAIEAILRIEKESHTTGLTENIEKMLGGKPSGKESGK